MQVNLTFDPKADSYEDVAALLEAIFNKPVITVGNGQPHLNMTAAEITEGDALVSAGTVSYGEQFNKSPETIALEQEIARKQLEQGSPLATPSLGAPSAGASSTTSTNPAAAGAEVDADGVIWDARIHAGTKTKNADGRWKAKKGVDKAYAAQIMAELRANPGAAVAAQQVPGATPLPTGGVLGAQPATIAIQTEQPATAAPTLAPTLAPVALPQPQATAVVAQTFEQFVEWATKHQQPWAPQGNVPFEVLVEALDFYNVKGADGNADVQLLQSRVDMVPHVHSYVLRKVGLL